MEKLVEKKKHNHKLTNCLKVLIFSMVMLAPFFAVLTKVIYVQSNQNAKESYYGQNINEEIQVQGYRDLQTYYNYQFGLPSVDSGNITYNVTSVKVIVPPTNYNFNQEFDNNVKEIYIYFSNGIHYTRIKFNDDTYQYVQNLNSSFQSMVLGFYMVSKPVNNAFSDYISYMTYNQNSYLDNVFYYAVEQLHDNQLFNWAKNTGIYNAIDEMTTGLNMGTNNTLALLLAYWSILIAVYIVFDIIIFIFTKITHFINE